MKRWEEHIRENVFRLGGHRYHLPASSLTCDKPPKNKGQASGSQGSDIDQYDPLFLHSNDTSGVPLINFILEGTENYKVWKAAITIAIHTTNKLGFINEKLSRLEEEGFKGYQSHNVSKTTNSAFVARPNNRNNKWNTNNNQPRRLKLPNLVCTHCNMNGHTADRYFELVGYPPTLRIIIMVLIMVVLVVMLSKDQSTSNSFTDDQYTKLMALISEKWSNSASQHVTYTVFNMFNVVNVSKLNKTVGHPNGTKAIVTHVGSLRLTDQIVIHDVLVVPRYEVSLLYVHKLSKDNKFRVILDENFRNHKGGGDEYISI
nr:hypothetical protein [Tanacetum cinerariifolium]